MKKKTIAVAQIAEELNRGEKKPQSKSDFLDDMLKSAEEWNEHIPNGKHTFVRNESGWWSMYIGDKCVAWVGDGTKKMIEDEIKNRIKLSTTPV